MEETTRLETQAVGVLLREILSPDGWGGKLLTPIRRLEIMPESVAAAFKLFLSRIGVGETFTLAELLMAGELLQRREVYGKPGDGIYLLREPVKDPRLGASLMERSVPGIYGLLTVAGGADLHLPVGVEEERIAFDRLLVMRERDGERLLSTGLVPLIRVGTVVPDRLRVSTDGGGLSADLSDLLLREAQVLTVEETDAFDYRPAFHALLGYGCCGTFPGKYYVNLASDRTLAQMFCGALGLFEGMLKYRFPLPPMRFNPNGSTGLVIPRPQIFAGDAVYVFRPRMLQGGDPVQEEYFKLRMFLMDSFRTQKVRSVLPLKENAPSMLRKLGGNELSLVEEMALPIGQFAMMAILPGGAQAPGTRVGYYRQKPDVTDPDGTV